MGDTLAEVNLLYDVSGKFRESTTNGRMEHDKGFDMISGTSRSNFSIASHEICRVFLPLRDGFESCTFGRIGDQGGIHIMCTHMCKRRFDEGSKMGADYFKLWGA